MDSSEKRPAVHIAVVNKPAMPTYEKLQRKTRESLSEKGGCISVLKLASQALEPFCPSKPLNIAILGANGCGKTSVVRRYAGDMFYEEPKDPLSNVFRTSMAISKDNTAKIFDVTVTETCRETQTDSAYREYIRSANAFVLVYSMNDFNSVLEFTKILTDLYLLNKENCPIVVIGNKTDLLDNVAPVTKEKTDFEKHLEFSGYQWFRVSAKSNEGILDAFLELTYLHSNCQRLSYII